jgi:lipoyl(octanoyl) transferase
MNSRGHLQVARLGTVAYETALGLQKAMVAARIANQIDDTLLLLEHPDVFTLGRGADERFIVDKSGKTPVFRVSRGGQVTYHGPGQLVGYPILTLEGPARDVGKYLRALEQAMIDALASSRIAAARRQGLTGVWIGDRKIASIGVGIRRWVTHHGFALNVSTDLARFESIVPCGIEGCRMTSVAAEGHPEVTLAKFADAMTVAFAATFDYARVERIENARLWRLVGSTSASAEARH